MAEVEYEVRDRIAYITLNRPDKLNAINAAVRQGLWDALTDVHDNDAVWIAIITGNGKAFCAGRDLIERVEQGEHLPGPTTADIYKLQQEIYKPLIAAVNGVCLAQGCGIALSTDIRIAAEGARFGWPQVKRGVSSISGPTLLSRLVPLNVALEYMFTGDFLTSDVALSLHLVNRVVPDGQALPAAEALARQLVQNAPLAMRSMKEAALRSRHLRADEAYLLARLILEQCDASEDAREGLRAFAEKRQPIWKGR